MSSFSKRKEIQHTPELTRILALPRRVFTPSEIEWIVDEMTAALKTPQGTMRLRPKQAIALAEIGLHGSMCSPLGVGEGKTLISLMAPYMIKAHAPMIVTRASLIDKTRRDRDELSKHWKIPKNIRIEISYEALGRVSAANILNVFEPDLVVTDESHRLKNKKASVTRRIARYLHTHPHAKFIAMSGTLIKDSLKDFAHLAHWCLPNGCPLPMHTGEVEEWADAIDERVNMLQRRAPGALVALYNDEERQLEPLRAVRQAFRRRFVETPGVVASEGYDVCNDEGDPIPLLFRAVPYESGQIIEQHFEKLRTEWETPDGWPLMEAFAVKRHAREIALGFHGVWSPRPPDEWMVPRKVWAKFVRDTISRSHSLDSEKQVALACVLPRGTRGALDDEAYKAWTEVRASFVPNPKDVWHDDGALRTIAAYAAEHKCIVWTKHTFLARELERRTGLQYFGRDTQNKAGRTLQDLSDAIRDKKEPLVSIIASADSCSTGLNLQPWSRNLITSMPGSSDQLEQLAGRTHRDGQKAEIVIFDVLMGCREHHDGWIRALSGAQMIRDTMGSMQKILLAQSEMPTVQEIVMRPGFRWQTPVWK